MSESMLQIDRGRLEVRWHGPRPAEAPTLVFLHEGLGSVSLWRDFPSLLAERTGCGALVYSRLGYGRSDPAEDRWAVDFLEREAIEVLPQVLAQTGVAEPLLVGHSDGASIALLFAAAFPRLPRALILEAPHVFVEPVTVASIAALGGAFKTGGLRRRLGRHHRDADATFARWREIWLDPAFRAWNIEDRLAAIRCPLLLLQGRDDEYGSDEQIRAIERGTGSAAQVRLIANCGHSPHRDQPEVVLDEAAAFVERILEAGHG